MAAQDEDDPGVLILSRFAGAAMECKPALLVNPYDAEAVAAAIHRALTMPIEERRARHKALYDIISRNDIDDWPGRFLSALTGAPTLDAQAGTDAPALANDALALAGRRAAIRPN